MLMSWVHFVRLCVWSFLLRRRWRRNETKIKKNLAETAITVWIKCTRRGNGKTIPIYGTGLCAMDVLQFVLFGARLALWCAWCVDAVMPRDSIRCDCCCFLEMLWRRLSLFTRRTTFFVFFLLRPRSILSSKRIYFSVCLFSIVVVAVIAAAAAFNHYLPFTIFYLHIQCCFCKYIRFDHFVPSVSSLFGILFFFFI